MPRDQEQRAEGAEISSTRIWDPAVGRGGGGSSLSDRDGRPFEAFGGLEEGWMDGRMNWRMRRKDGEK